MERSNTCVVMKNNHLFAILQFALISVFFASCSSKEYQMAEFEESHDTKFVNSKLIKDLTNINEHLLTNRIETQTRWTGKQWLNVASADIGGAWKGGKGGAWIGAKVGTFLGNPLTGATFGAFLGGAICGAAASYLASPDTKVISKQSLSYDTMKEICNKALDCSVIANTRSSTALDGGLTINSESIIMNAIAQEKIELGDEILSAVNLSQQNLNVGKMHNVILSVLDGSTTINESKVVNTENIFYNSIIESGEMEELFEEMKTNMAVSATPHIDTKAEYAMELFENLFVKYSEENKDVVYIINKYSDIIKASTELTDEEKDWIMTGLATALYSFNYWNVTFEN